MGINRSGFYKWRKNKSSPPPGSKQKRREDAMELFSKYHGKYPSHGYRWLNAKIKLDCSDKSCPQANYSDQFAHRVCQYLGIKSKAKKVCRYGKGKLRSELLAKNFPNLLLRDLEPQRPLEIIVSDMTAFYHHSIYYELTLFMDLFNNEIIAYYLTKKRGNPVGYYESLEQVLKQKNSNLDYETILHTDQGSVYMSKEFNKKLAHYNIIHSVSKPGTPTENGAMEAINGWMKEELFGDSWLPDDCDTENAIKRYIHYFNYERPAYALKYLTPIQYKQKYDKSVKNGKKVST